MKKAQKETVLVPIDIDDFWHEMRQLVRQELTKLLKDPVLKEIQSSPQGISDKPLYTIPEVCKMFDITRPTMYEWIKDGKLNPKKVRGRVFFIGNEVRCLIEDKEEGKGVA